jgi:hypothetical protein
MDPAAGQDPSAVDEYQDVNDSIGTFVPFISPWRHERSFWQSKVFLDAMQDRDSFFLFLQACENGLILFRSLPGVPDEIAGHFWRQSKRVLALVGFHVAFRFLSPEMYLQVRAILVLHFRCDSWLPSFSISACVHSAADCC